MSQLGQQNDGCTGWLRASCSRQKGEADQFLYGLRRLIETLENNVVYWRKRAEDAEKELKTERGGR